MLYAAHGGLGLDDRATTEELLRFECTQCGLCCTARGDYAHVYVDEKECKSLARFLRLSLQDLKRRFTFVDDDGWRQLRFEQGGCVFLDAKGRCRVYLARPSQCRTFPFWPELIRRDRWTRHARRLCEGVGRGPGFSSREVRERLDRARQAESGT